MGIEFFKQDDFASSDDCRLFRFEVARKSNKLLSQNLPRLYEALGMKRVYYEKGSASHDASIREILGDAIFKTRISRDTHAFWMTEPEEICKHENKDVDTSQVLTSNPPQYRWKCRDCDETGYIFCNEYKSPEEGKVECDHSIVYRTENPVPVGISGIYAASPVKDDWIYCPKCGQKLEGEE